MTETWLPCPDYEGRYEVSNLGRVRSLARVEMSAAGRRIVRERILKPMWHTDGYRQISLRKAGKMRTVRVHRLICRAFHGEPSAGKEVAHLDGNGDNNCAVNLAWVTHAENIAHKTIHGTTTCGEGHPNSKLTAEAVTSIWQSNEDRKALAAMHNVTICTISDIKIGRRWAHVTAALVGVKS